MRRGWAVIVGIMLLAACGPTVEEEVSGAFQDAASRSLCVQVFETYRDDLADARITGNIEKVVRQFYTDAVLACPSAGVWNEVAEQVAPDSVSDWSTKYGRQSVLRGMCAEIEDPGFDPPACD